ncbi:hypothetical protein I7I50_11083 [Histoplasma capsulatum G186AR]|uniref:Uncharacterized protein n=1 Tax=Ajellomyces capsulatus TaxID=5037 RepID=A0A8H7Z551_AJECA|nr:hypothetical protein I7I52_02322 [Histoplasma capsulatum]QSS69700.1 hypothetical protein I7I50_11083 [Histoplasma capsulatum G186AR]
MRRRPSANGTNQPRWIFYSSASRCLAWAISSPPIRKMMVKAILASQISTSIKESASNFGYLFLAADLQPLRDHEHCVIIVFWFC